MPTKSGRKCLVHQRDGPPTKGVASGCNMGKSGFYIKQCSCRRRTSLFQPDSSAEDSSTGDPDDRATPAYRNNRRHSRLETYGRLIVCQDGPGTSATSPSLIGPKCIVWT
ncbi:Putative Zn(II)2Cys6 transcription factor (Eurofu ng) [Trichuris trichiura]|uniref:Putative Zn(II)2Cys6 transcription factor (Eurofu ng) n=1 Tax=Trichuris trichiura TaxID=36087 RepID=A0A077YYQ6_TRITR|nr:Putative Zn(II)2Cys6 transcription factor (Eurofu ng) [Trichuris trichiura]